MCENLSCSRKGHDDMNLTVPSAMSFGALAQKLNIRDPATMQSLMQANNISSMDQMLPQGAPFVFPDQFGGGGLFQALRHLFGLDGAMPLPPPGAAGGPQSQAAPAQGVGGGGGGGGRPMHQSQPRSFFHNPVGAIKDRYRQFTGQPLDGDADASSQDGLKDRGIDTPFQQGNPALESSADAKGDVHVNTPHVTQWNSIACKDASDVVVQRTGGRPRPPNNRIQVATSRPSGASANVSVNPAGAQAGLARINSELDANHAVEVGVAHDNGGGHNPQTGGMTDHFVAITGRGTDEQGRRFYTFHDPAYSTGSDQNPRNRFYVDPDTGGLFRPGASRFSGGPTFSKYRFEVTEVR
jgi:hypothetical protein